MLNCCLSVVLSLAYPLPKHLVEEGKLITTTTKGVGSTRSLLRYIFMRCAYVGIMSVVTNVIAKAIAIQFWEEMEAIDDFVELCRNLCSDLVRFLTGKRRIRGKVGCENPLPGELWGLIGKRLTSQLDILRFRSVCKGWRSSLPCPTRFPLSVPPPPNCDPNMPYFITQVTLYRCKGRHLAVAFEEVDRDGKFRGCYLSPWKLKCDLPMISFVGYPKHRRSKISYLATGYRLRMGLPCFDSHQERVEGQWNLQDNKFVNKIVLISSESHDDGVNPSYARASDLSVVAHLSFGGMEGRLALLRLGGSPENWRWDTDFCTQVFKGMSTYKGQLCTLDQWGRVFFVDYDSLQMTQVGDPLSFIPEPDLSIVRLGEMERKHLFESHGELYAYDGVHFKRTRRVEVYKLCLRRKKWVKPTEHMGKHVWALAPYYM